MKIRLTRPLADYKAINYALKSNTLRVTRASLVQGRIRMREFINDIILVMEFPVGMREKETKYRPFKMKENALLNCFPQPVGICVRK